MVAPVCAVVLSPVVLVLFVAIQLNTAPELAVSAKLKAVPEQILVDVPLVIVGVAAIVTEVVVVAAAHPPEAG